LIIGFFLESLNPVTISEVSSELYVFNEPLLFAGLRYFFPAPENGMLHPTVFAGWVGLFVTALNLIPGGQLDGGHIARALFGENARYMSYFVIMVLFSLSILTSSFLWIFFILIILLSGTSHPPPLNDISPLGYKRRAIGAFCIAMLLLCIHYAPISIISPPEHELDFECDNSNQVVELNGTAEYSVKVIYNGEEDGKIEFSYYSNSSKSNLSDWFTEIELLDSNN
jgi:membrane-associated protease RseP (regulator of RpoE activity)